MLTERERKIQERLNNRQSVKHLSGGGKPEKIERIPIITEPVRIPIVTMREPIITYRVPIITRERIPILTYNDKQKPMVDVIVDYYEFLARQAKGIQGYCVCGNSREYRNIHRNWQFFVQTYLILKERGWKYREYLTVQFERASRWNHGARREIPLPNALYGDNARHYFNNWIADREANSTVVSSRPQKFVAEREKPFHEQIAEQIEIAVAKVAEYLSYYLKCDRRFDCQTDEENVLLVIQRHWWQLTPWYCVTKLFITRLMDGYVLDDNDEEIITCPREAREFRVNVMLLQENTSRLNMELASKLVKTAEKRHGIAPTPKITDVEDYLGRCSERLLFRVERQETRLLEKAMSHIEELGIELDGEQLTSAEIEYFAKRSTKSSLTSERINELNQQDAEELEQAAARQQQGWNIIDKWRQGFADRTTVEEQIEEAEQLYADGVITNDGWVLQPIWLKGDSNENFKPYLYSTLFNDWYIDDSGRACKRNTTSDSRFVLSTNVRTAADIDRTADYVLTAMSQFSRVV